MLTDSEIIDRLGGTTEVARMFEIEPPSVSEWRVNGIPKARRLHLKAIRPDLFPEEATKPAKDRRKLRVRRRSDDRQKGAL
jgi:hypothetical protein